MNGKEKVLLFLLIFYAFSPAFARRIADFSSKTDVLQQVERKLALTAERLKKGSITNQVAAGDYLEMINLLQSLYHQGLSYSKFKSALRNMENAISGYYNCVYYGETPVEVGKREQMILGSFALDMSEFLDKASNYIRGKVSDILGYVIPLLANSSPKDELKDVLFSLTESKDNLSRFYAVKALGQLVKSSFNPVEQDEIVEKISGLIKNEDILVTGCVVQTLGDVLSSVEINHVLRDEIISDLINLYARPLHYPLSSYLTNCLKSLVNNEPDKWRKPLAEILGKYHIIDRDSILSYIFGEEKY